MLMVITCSLHAADSTESDRRARVELDRNQTRGCLRLGQVPEESEPAPVLGQAAGRGNAKRVGQAGVQQQAARFRDLT